MRRARHLALVLVLLSLSPIAAAQNAARDSGGTFIPGPRPRVQAAKLIKKVQPVYPEEARRADLQGLVKLNVRVDAQGRVSAVEVVSGAPLLAAAATEAVRQWEYEPFRLEGAPAEVWTQVSVAFLLKGPVKKDAPRRN